MKIDKLPLWEVLFWGYIKKRSTMLSRKIGEIKCVILVSHKGTLVRRLNHNNDPSYNFHGNYNKGFRKYNEREKIVGKPLSEDKIGGNMDQTGKCA